MRRRWTVVVAVLGVVACSGGGGTTCVVSTGQGGSCREDLDEAECRQRSDSTTSANDCESLGYTKQCPGETATFRRPEHTC